MGRDVGEADEVPDGSLGVDPGGGCATSLKMTTGGSSSGCGRGGRGYRRDAGGVGSRTWQQLGQGNDGGSGGGATEGRGGRDGRDRARGFKARRRHDGGELGRDSPRSDGSTFSSPPSLSQKNILPSHPTKPGPQPRTPPLVPISLLHSSLVPISLAAATNSARSQRPPAGIDGAQNTNVTLTLRSPLLSGEIRRTRPPAAKHGCLPLLGFRSLMDPAPAGNEGRQIRYLGGTSRRIREQHAAPCSRQSRTSAAGRGRWRQTPALLCFINLDGCYSAKDVSYRSRTSYLLISQPGLGSATAPTTMIPVTTRQGSAMTSLTFFSCGYCGYTLNLSSSTRNTTNIGSKYGNQIRKAGALLLRTVGGVSDASVLLEATVMMAGVYGGDQKLSSERLPLLPLVLFSTPIALLCWFRTLATGVVKAY
ncbi:uncharacterized protein [Triticum aestivum]|uniref:uncharacterized protein n=1 Tax=Triticum aestivum TaxID=4565 RepID=UPI001D004E54|nr:uncharacterized protein LOC123157913 [Triticum aestivum]